MSKIVIDPGHGGVTNHAKGPKGTLEKNMALTIAVKTAEILNQAGHDVVLTRNNDTNVALADRAKVAANKKADVFVSIHFNGNADPKVQGTECWVHPAAGSDSKLLASSLLQRLAQVTGYKNRGLFSGRLIVLSPSIHFATTACCLIEISFITNPADEDRLLTAAYQKQLASGISVAITDYIKKSTTITSLDATPGTIPEGEGNM